MHKSVFVMQIRAGANCIRNANSINCFCRGELCSPAEIMVKP